MGTVHCTALEDSQADIVGSAPRFIRRIHKLTLSAASLAIVAKGCPRCNAQGGSAEWSPCNAQRWRIHWLTLSAASLASLAKGCPLCNAQRAQWYRMDTVQRMTISDELGAAKAGGG